MPTDYRVSSFVALRSTNQSAALIGHDMLHSAVRPYSFI